MVFVLEKVFFRVSCTNTAVLKQPRRTFLNARTHGKQRHSRSQGPRSFWSAPRIATSGQVQHRKSAIHGLPVTLRMFRVKFDKSDWFWSQSIVFTEPFKNGMPLDEARGRYSWYCPKGARPLGTRTKTAHANFSIRA